MAPESGTGRELNESRLQLQDALEDLLHASRLPPKQRKADIKSTLDTICDAAFEHGLPPTAIDTILDIITLPNQLNQAATGRLIRGLYPAERVHDAAVVTVVGCLGQGGNKPAAGVQVALLRWLTLAYEMVEDRQAVSQFYGVLFNLLSTYGLRAQLCHLIALTTRRKHVRPFRIQLLLELSRTAVNEPHLVGLIRVFKEYYPDVIVGEAAAGRASVFTCPDPEWRDRALLILRANEQDGQETRPAQAAFKVMRRGAKRGKVSAVPEVLTSNATENSVTLEEIDNVDSFVQRLERIQLPNQVIAVLSDPLLQKYLSLKPSAAATRRMEHWLSASLEEELQCLDDRQQEPGRLSGLLDSILIYARYTKEMPPTCQGFLKAYIPRWNGEDDREAILELATFLPITAFSGLQMEFFCPLEQVILNGHFESSLVLLDFYTALLRRWTVRLLTGGAYHPPRSTDIAPASFKSLILHADTLCLSIFESRSPINLRASSAALSFYEAVAGAIENVDHYTAIRITTPSSLLTYLLTFTPSLSTLSRLCAILATYKRAFEGAMSAAQNAGFDGMYPRDEVNHFNGFLMDICNCIWRNRGFNRNDANAHGCFVPTTVVSSLQTYVERLDHSVPALFSLSQSTILCALSIACFRGLEDVAMEDLLIRHAGPVSQRSLAQLGEQGGLKISWSNYRLEVIRWLEERGVKGVGELMYNTMKHLLRSRGMGMDRLSIGLMETPDPTSTQSSLR